MADTNKTAAPAAAATPAHAEVCPMCKKVHEQSFSAAFERLKKGPRLLAKALRGLKKKTYDRTYAPGKWSIRQIVCHLRDCEMVYATRYRKLVAEDNPALLAFDQDRWADHTAYAKQDGEAAREAFAALREANIEMLELTDKAARERRGTHAEYGVLTIDLLVRHIVEHDRNHIEQIEQAREAKVKKPRPEKVS
jgi:uncharacterized damage-inducible protein DinB